MVSVIMVTYGHEKYIEEAINGVFIQQTDFPVELIIANDCSPDQTDKVVKSLLPKSPENVTVKYTKHEFNKGANNNFNWAASQATGKYIALCEGDDYWTDPLKLQKQVDFLEENENYSAVISDRIIKNTATGVETISDYPLITNTNQILRGEVMPTQCLLFRNKISFDDLQRFRNHPAGDRALSYLLSLKGPIYCIKEIMAVYNYTGEGVWSKKKSDNQTLLNARSLKDFYDLVGLKRGNGYVYQLVAMLISERSKGKLRLTDGETLRDFEISPVQLLAIKSRVFLSKIKSQIWK